MKRFKESVFHARRNNVAAFPAILVLTSLLAPFVSTAAEKSSGNQEDLAAMCSDETGDPESRFDTCYQIKDFGACRKAALRLCEAGDGRYCGVLGYFFSEGTGGPKDVESGRIYSQKSCDLSNAGGCWHLSLYWMNNGPEDARDPVRGAEFAIRACGLGSAEGCFSSGHYYRDGIGVAKSDENARRAYVAGCEAGSGEACVNGSHMMMNGQGGEEDFPGARRLMKIACDQGLLAGCSDLGVLLKNGLGGPQDTEVALEYYLKACNGGFGRACFNLGIFWDDPPGKTPDPVTALAFFEKACGLGVGNACHYAALYRAGGNGCDKDQKEADRLNMAGCELGDPDSCAKVSVFWLTQFDSPDRIKLSLESGRKSCEGGNSEGCSSIGRTMWGLGDDNGLRLLAASCLGTMKDVSTFGCFALGTILYLALHDEKASRTAFSLACHNGDPAGCVWLAALSFQENPKDSTAIFDANRLAVFKMAEGDAESSLGLAEWYRRTGDSDMHERLLKSAIIQFESTCKLGFPASCRMLKMM